MKEIEVKSSVDGSAEKSLFFFPDGAENVPLVVGLHTWSYDRFNQKDVLLPFCRKFGWALLLPEFRGPNLESNPRRLQTAGSEIARQDVFDAIAGVTGKYAIDTSKIFLSGGSGGGMMALLVAGTKPEVFRGVSAWCPITDLALWHRENRSYSGHVEACCGGAPDDFWDEYAMRSPINLAENLRNVRLSIHHGRNDDVVHYSHTLKFVERLGVENSEELYFEIFDGRHELRPERTFEWFRNLALKQNITRLTG